MRIFKILTCASLLLAFPCAEALVHVVRKGDNLTTIAQSYKISVASIKTANKIKDADKIRIGQKLQIPGAAPAFTSYKIKPGDSLSSIASKHGLSTKQLSAYNGIRNANKIRFGQTIRIPSSSAAAASKYARLPAGVKAALDKIAVKRGQWKNIVIHHSGTPADRAINMARFHKEERNMENGLAYHFVIENGTRGTSNGDIFVGDRWKKQLHGGHMKIWAHNQIAIGICLIGNFEKSRPKEKQMEQLEVLISYLRDKTGIPAKYITTHTLMHPKHTLCPGKYFPTSRLKAMVQ
ncbi:MAG: LysM peptidoglycan-binding domain-containing protein [Opitutales bacterium]|jgi:LysM repeat protein|nr:LysM peptidoglycan-binding domain-containing protein [Opitutales bacterium]MDG2255882.1 LysM peptidoglycan-binding domain-containing protein [Opitutaceae bacterium]MBT5167611.1 LysM peptidoglycan-binding domain-containing protein [Opitutales bacterium]MBT5813190.1 LysM peptidoglycan-binding domain-containing protein [Opitutales bacterium]MBT6379628.1 LysM peptidoglycan-binding domain-containing protein [Opitutales bacterium]